MLVCGTWDGTVMSRISTSATSASTVSVAARGPAPDPSTRAIRRGRERTLFKRSELSVEKKWR